MNPVIMVYIENLDYHGEVVLDEYQARKLAESYPRNIYYFWENPS